jgi:DNA-directed RNA polymerase specialized sigma subunit
MEEADEQSRATQREGLAAEIERRKEATWMTAKEWLKRGWKLDREITALLRTKEETRERLMSITAGYAGEPVQGTRDPHRYDRLAELDDMIDQRIDQLVQIKAEITDAIARVQDSRYRTLLTERYLRYRTWEQIAVDMNYTWRRVMQLHGEALLAMEDVLQKIS